MKSRQFDLAGMFLILDSPDQEHYRTVQIVATVAKFNSFDKLAADHTVPPLELHALDGLSWTLQNCGQKLANLTRAKLKRWVV